MSCETCCIKDDQGNFLVEPCCNIGECEATRIGSDDDGMRIHCGAEMFRENGLWFHHEQKDIPFNDRGTTHWEAPQQLNQ